MAVGSRARRRTVHVIVTCSYRKSRPVPSTLHLRRVTGVRITTRLNAWTGRLDKGSGIPVPARDLYAGEHWNVARQLASHSTKATRIVVWVCSAGYGLISIDAPIRPYSATFAAGHPDSVPGGRAGLAAWWAALAEWPGPAEGPRSLAELATSHAQARLLLVLSGPYFAACRDDILDAVEAMRRPERLSIISAGTRGDRDLAEFLLPVDARLQSAVGGTRQSLNARVANRLLARGLTDDGEMRDQLAKLLARAPALPRFDRRRVTDAQVRRFIRARVRRDPYASHTRLLRELRSSGRASEQDRFAALFRAETAVV